MVWRRDIRDEVDLRKILNSTFHACSLKVSSTTSFPILAGRLSLYLHCVELYVGHT